MRLAPIALAAPILAVASSASGQCVEGCTALHTLMGEAPGDQYGWVSNDLGDLNDDGISEFVLTAPTNDAGGSNAGRIYVYDGASAKELWKQTGLAGGWWLGHDAACAGDVTGDGVPDVIAGAPFFSSGRAIIYDGTDGSFVTQFIGQAIGDQFGFRVYGGGDFDGDGTSDVVVGAPLNDTVGSGAGRAYVYSGDGFGLICAIDGPTNGDQFGSGVAFVGDLNGDGRDDIAVGSQSAGPVNGGLGFAYGWDGKACVELFVMTPAGPSSNFGQWFMNGGHDVNRDGTPDIYINDFGVNQAHIFSGVDGSIIWTLNGDGSGGFGIGRIVEDIDGDCYADMILAAWASSAGAGAAGKAFVYSGRTGLVLDTYTHDVAGAGFGFDANGMGDVDGNGTFDYLITAASDLGSRGVAYVISGEIAAPVPGDVTGDDLVTFDDLVAMLANWGPCDAAPATCASDFDCSGAVDFGDIVTLLANWS